METQIEEESGAPQSGKRRVIGAVVVIAILVLLASLRGLLTLYTDYLWFDDLERTSVWAGILQAKIVLSVIFVAIFFVLAWLNLVIADRIAPALRPPGPEEELLLRWHETIGRRNGLIRFAIAGFFALIAGGGAGAQWNEWVLFRNPVTFGEVDPLFGRDTSFYMFQLPFLGFIVSWFFAAFLIIGIITGIWHYVNGGIRVRTVDYRTTPQVKAHLSVILAVLAALKAADYYLQRFELLGSGQGFRRGAFYTDVNASLPAIQLLLLISIFSVGLLVANIWRRGWALPTVAVGLWGLIAVLAGGIYPAVIQQFQVQRDELTLERPFMERNIEATRLGMGLDEIIDGEFAIDAAANEDDVLTREEVLRNSDVFSTVRLLDPRIVDDSFTRNQQVRGEIYAEFGQKVDVDRYVIDGELTPVVVAARELANGSRDSWEIRHAAETHGYGLVMAPANRFNSNGKPVFLIGDAPLENRIEDSVSIDQPQIYFGEDIDSYAITGTTANEFDFIDGYAYDGEGGVPMSGFFSRLAFSFRFGAIDPMISGIIDDGTEVLFERDVTTRARRIAPFLQYDSDPYPIVVNGRIAYVIDAYTTSDRLPYAEFADVSQLSNSADLRTNFNYVRNSVKVVVDAYDGTVDFYVVDAEDPVLEAYRQAFDGLFRDASEMPPEVAEHLRYPHDLFVIQTGMWSSYQLEIPGQFYTQNLGWDIASNPDTVSGGNPVTQLDQSDPTSPRIVATRSRPVDPYYQVTRLPDETETSFVVTRTFTPVGVPQLKSYMVGRVDTTGKLELREYELNTTAEGPVQVDETLNADPEISEESTELGRGGSQWLSGNLIPLLVEDAVVYVRPFYVRREPLPEAPDEKTEPQVQFVAVVQGKQLGFAPTYAGALAQLFNISREEANALIGLGDADISTDPDDDTGVTGNIDRDNVSAEVSARLDEILAKFGAAEAALPDFAEYQRIQNEALSDLQRLLDEVDATTDETPVEPTEDEEPDSA